MDPQDGWTPARGQLPEVVVWLEPDPEVTEVPEPEVPEPDVPEPDVPLDMLVAEVVLDDVAVAVVAVVVEAAVVVAPACERWTPTPPTARALTAMAVLA